MLFAMSEGKRPDEQAWVLERAAEHLINIAESLRNGAMGVREVSLLERITDGLNMIRIQAERIFGIRGTAEELKALMLNEPEKVKKSLSHALKKDYDKLEILGKGGMGIVFGAKNTDLGRFEALKCVFEGSTPLGQELFRNEAKLTARVPQHPHVVALHGIREVTIQLEGKLYTISLLVLEYIEKAKDGKKLLPFLPTHVSLTLALFSQIAEGLSCAHQHDIFHRDIKPANVLISGKIMALFETWHESTQAEKGSVDLAPDIAVKALLNTKGVKIADFGLASSGEKTEKEGSGGTAQYMPPEAHDAGADGKACDVYALALTLYFFLTGKENPLKHSLGLDDETWKHGTSTNFYTKFAKAMQEGKSSAISPDDPELLALLSRDPHAGPIVTLLFKMGSFDPKQRPSIDWVKTVLRKELEARSPEAKRLRRLQKVKRRGVQTIGCLAIGLLGLLVAIPIKERRERRHHTIEEHGHAIESAKEFAEKKEWANLLNLIKAALHHLLEETVLSEEERNTLEKELKQWHAYAEAMRQAEELQSQGKDAEAKKMRKTAELLKP